MTYLRCAVPAIAAVHEHTRAVIVHVLDNLQRSVEHGSHMLQPLGALQVEQEVLVLVRGTRTVAATVSNAVTASVNARRTVGVYQRQAAHADRSAVAVAAAVAAALARRLTDTRQAGRRGHVEYLAQTLAHHMNTVS